MRIPPRKEAEDLIFESENMNPGPWGNHCRVAADCAEKIACQCPNLDSESAYILGLLHDIGRRFGISHFGHVVDGYRFMLGCGYEDVARICLTHSFQVQDMDTYIGNFDVPKEDIVEMANTLSGIIYDDYDRLLQLCDCLASAEGVVDIKDRLDDVSRRYLDGQYPERKRAAIMGLKSYFEHKTGKNIYEIVSDNRLLWGR